NDDRSVDVAVLEHHEHFVIDFRKKEPAAVLSSTEHDDRGPVARVLFRKHGELDLHAPEPLRIAIVRDNAHHWLVDATSLLLSSPNLRGEVRRQIEERPHRSALCATMLSLRSWARGWPRSSTFPISSSSPSAGSTTSSYRYAPSTSSPSGFP